MKRRALVVFLFAGFLSHSHAALAETQPAAPAFDVATVKPSAPLDMAKLRADAQAGKMPHLGPFVEGSRAEYLYMTPKQLLAIAYHVKEYQISGPDWLSDEHFDIEATLPDGTNRDDVPAMLQSLLKERFKLAAHKSTEEHKVLALVVAKGGPKLKEVPAPPALDLNAPLKPGEQQMDGPDGPVRIMRNPDRTTTFNLGARGIVTNRINTQAQSLDIESNGVTLSGFADILTRVLQLGNQGGPQVVDQTGLKGYYEITTEISFADLMSGMRGFNRGAPPSNSDANANPAAAASDPSGEPTVFASVEKLGLKLEERKAPVEQLVIDHMEKTPTEN
ncbi:MAG TPA: TIGR03435 family protein [Terracidiphilus sp.]|nr:TIGR03435 family protein [Terracidiphilus sp.]